MTVDFIDGTRTQSKEGTLRIMNGIMKNLNTENILIGGILVIAEGLVDSPLIAIQ